MLHHSTGYYYLPLATSFFLTLASSETSHTIRTTTVTPEGANKTGTMKFREGPILNPDSNKNVRQYLQPIFTKQVFSTFLHLKFST